MTWGFYLIVFWFVFLWTSPNFGAAWEGTSASGRTATRGSVARSVTKVNGYNALEAHWAGRKGDHSLILMRISSRTRTTSPNIKTEKKPTPNRPVADKSLASKPGNSCITASLLAPKGFAEIQQGCSDGALRHADAVIFRMEPDRLSVALESTRYFHNAFGARLLKLVDE